MTTSSPLPTVLGLLLRTVHFRSEVIFHGRLCDEWSVDSSGSGNICFHAVNGDDCWLHLRSLPEPRRLQHGDVVVLPADAQHAINPYPDRATYGQRGATRIDPILGAAPGTDMLCGYVNMHRSARDLVFATVPDHLVVGPRQPGAEQVGRLTEAIFEEASEASVGAIAMVERLADALMLKVFELGIAALPEPAGFYAGLADPQIGRAIAAAWAAPENPWTVESLASAAAMSRSAFAARFTELVGRGPLELLTAWRMQLAWRMLEREQASVAAVAEQVGYTAEAAFRKAFKRHFGTGPGEVRRR